MYQGIRNAKNGHGLPSSIIASLLKCDTFVNLGMRGIELVPHHFTSKTKSADQTLLTGHTEIPE